MDLTQMQYELNKLNNVILDQNMNMKKQDSLIQELNFENSRLQQVIDQRTYDLQNYQETLKKLYLIYVDQQKFIENVKLNNIDLTQGIDRVNSNNVHLNNDIQNILAERNVVLNQVSQQEQAYQSDIQNLAAQLSDKNMENVDLKRRVNDLLDMKRRLEEETISLRFSLDNLRQKLDIELKEKTLKLEQLDRSFHEAMQVKQKEINNLIEKIKQLEHENIITFDKNKQQQIDISYLANQLKQCEDELRKLKMGQEGSSADKKSTFENEQKYLDKIKRLEEQLDHEKMKNIKKQNSPKQVVVDGANSGGDIDLSYQLSNDMLSVITYVRESIQTIIFELFVRSVNHANQKKQNSLIIFILNLKELKEKYWKGLQLILDLYVKIKKQSVDFIEASSNTRKFDSIRLQFLQALGQIQTQNVDLRDNVNKWIEGTLSFTLNKRQQESNEKNQEYLFLFRLLTIKYRVRYPLRGKSFTIDKDLDAYLDNKILSALRKVLQSQD